jgi:hypothetical protein
MKDLRESPERYKVEETLFHFFFFPPFAGLAYLAASWSKKSSATAAF